MLVCVEALVRWHSRRLGKVAPGEFLPIAEETGMVIDIDRWVLREACRKVAKWQRQAPEAPLRLSVNLSGRQFSRPDLVPFLNEVLTDTGFDPHFLTLEITETSLLQPSPMLMSMMDEITQTGIELHIDDFGTGHSTLSYLQTFPVRSLKVDRSFVGNMLQGTDGAQLVNTILRMAHTLDMTVTAEGIEKVEQLEHLSDLGCEYGQGFLFSEPMTAGAFEAWRYEALRNEARPRENRIGERSEDASGPTTRSTAERTTT